MGTDWVPTTHPEQVTAVLGMPDDPGGLRNRMITDLYRRTGTELTHVLGGTDVTWFTYGALASRTVGELLAGRPGPEPPRRGLRYRVARLGQQALQRTPVAGRLFRAALAEANLDIFAEVMPPFTILLTELRPHVDAPRASRRAAADAAVDAIRADRSSMRQPLRNDLVEALRATAEAFAADEPDRRCAIHRATLHLAAVEQSRIDERIDVMFGGRVENVIDPTRQGYRPRVGFGRRCRQRIARAVNLLGSETIVLDVPSGAVAPSQGAETLGSPDPILVEVGSEVLARHRDQMSDPARSERLNWARLDHRLDWFAQLVACTQRELALLDHGVDPGADAMLPRVLDAGPGFVASAGSDRPPRLLAIDHAPGPRSTVSLAVLAAIERSVGTPLGTHFDGVAGAGSGALLAAGVSSGSSVDDIAQAWTAAGLGFVTEAGGDRRLRIGHFLEMLGGGERPEQLSLGTPWLRTLFLLVLHNRDTTSPWVLTNSRGAKYNDPLSAGNNLQLPLRDLLAAGLVDPRHDPPDMFAVLEDGEVHVRRMYGPDWTPFANPALALLRVSRLEPWGIGWQGTTARPTELVSVGAGRTVVPPGAIAADGEPTATPDVGWLSLSHSASVQQDAHLRLLSTSSTGPRIDAELGDASDLVLADGRLRYLRFDLEPSVAVLGRTPSLSQRFVNDDFADDHARPEAIAALADLIAAQVEPALTDRGAGAR